ncbi:CHRNA7 [Mytilus coruscus]|uniref:CHRNA7 n=1 Tax=Mytilus coruscus TaxID=42192 RepID=A0A6J7ZXD6_MYTCO|nr:CHRNA7 [Mytilus coruscus]
MLNYYYCYVAALEDVNHELLLRNVLFNESTYSSQVIPRRNVTETVQISMKWTFIRLEGLTWTDDYLVWDPSQYGGKSYITATGKQVWTPDVRIYNKLESNFLSDGLQAEKVLVKYDGTVMTQPSGDLSTICNANIELFPADCQKCSIVLGTTTVNQRQKLVWDQNEPISGYEENKDDHAFWKILKVEKVPMFPSTFVFYIFMQRLPAHYIYNIVFPACALSILAILAFFIPIDAGERIGFGITIFLSFMVLMLQVSSVLPENSKSISAIGKYFLQLMCSSLVAVLSSVVLSYNDRKPENEKCKCRLNSVHPIIEDSTGKDDHVIAFNDNHIATNADKNRILLQPRNIMTWWKIMGYKKLMNYLRPVKIFDLVTLLSCLIASIHAHIELYIIMTDTTCSSGT